MKFNFIVKVRNKEVEWKHAYFFILKGSVYKN